MVTPSFLGEFPQAPWCLVITAEGQGGQPRGEVEGVIDGFREGELAFSGLFPRPVCLDVNDALASPEAWLSSVAALAKGASMVADVSGYQPGVMVLLGARSVLRRGVTVSVKAGESGIDQTELPFNVPRDPGPVVRRGAPSTTICTTRWWRGSPGIRAGPELSRPSRLPRGPDAPVRKLATGDKTRTVCSSSVRSPRIYSGILPAGLQAVVRPSHRQPTSRPGCSTSRSPRLVGQALYGRIGGPRRCNVDPQQGSASQRLL